MDLCTIIARVLNSPDITYRRRGRGEIVEHVNVGKWKIRNWFYESPPINSWGLIYFCDRPNYNRVDDIVDQFQNELPQVINSFISLRMIFISYLASCSNWFFNQL